MQTMILFFIMVIGYSFHSLFTRLYAANYAGKDASMATPIFSVIHGGAVALISFIAGGMIFAPSWQTVLLGVLNAGILILFNIATIEVGNRGPYSFMMVCSMFGGILVPVVVGPLFMGEPFGVLQGAAAILMMVALVLMNGQKISLKGASQGYYFWCLVLFLSNGVFGVIQNLQVKVMGGMQRSEMLTILYGCSALGVLLPMLVRGQGKKFLQGLHMGKKAGIHLTVACFATALAVNLLLFILNNMPSSMLYTMDNGAVLVLSILYALVLFKEKPTKAQVLGMILAVCSIVVINL